MMVEVKFLHARLRYGCYLHSFYLLDELKFASWHTAPDGLCVDVHRSNPLQQELHHFQEWIAGLFGAAKFFSDVSLKGRQLRTSIYLCTNQMTPYEQALCGNAYSTSSGFYDRNILCAFSVFPNQSHLEWYFTAGLKSNAAFFFHFFKMWKYKHSSMNAQHLIYSQQWASSFSSLNCCQLSKSAAGLSNKKKYQKYFLVKYSIVQVSHASPHFFPFSKKNGKEAQWFMCKQT